MARSYLKNSEIFFNQVGLLITERCREIFLQQKSCSLTVIIRQRQHAAAAAASSTGSSGSSGRGWRAARAAAAGSAAAVQAAAHVVCGSGGGSGGCGGTSGAGCRCRMPRRVLGHAAAAVIAPTAPACGGGVCGCVSMACVCGGVCGGVEITVSGHTPGTHQAHTRHMPTSLLAGTHHAHAMHMPCTCHAHTDHAHRMLMVHGFF